MRPKVNEGSVDLFNVGLLFLVRLDGEGSRRDSIEVDLELQLVLNVNPEHLEEVVWISFFIKIPILIKINILHECLACMDLGLEVLAIHKDTQQALGGAIVEELSKVSGFIVLVNRVN